MFSMIIADDENKVRNGLIKVIPWENYEIEIIGDAENGVKALELCEKYEPDILFTDIRMPIMNGLETAQKLKDLGLKTKVLLISGAEDFEYAKSALRLNVAGYILKPVKIDELKEAISQIVENIKIDKFKELNLQKIKKQLQENMAIAKNVFLKSLISGKQIKEKDIIEKLEFMKLPLKVNESVMVAAFQIDDYNKKVLTKNEEDRQILNLSVMNITEEIINSREVGICFSPEENEFVIIFNNIMKNKRYAEIMEEITLCMKKNFEVTCSFGVGTWVKKLNEVMVSYSEAITALSYSFYTEGNSIHNINDVRNMMISKEDENSEFNNLVLIGNQLLSSMKLGDNETILSIINNLFGRFYIGKKYNIEYVQSLCIEFLFGALRVAYEFGDDFSDVGLSLTGIIKNVLEFNNISNLQQYMTSVFTEIAKRYSLKYNSNKSNTISRIKEIVNKKYFDNLSLQTIADEVHFTPSYISMIFKQETGTNLIEYITKFRVEKAKELLTNSGIRVSEVAKMVGFDNPHYFSTVYKKYTGLRPNEFRGE